MMSLPFFGFLIFIQGANIPTFKTIAKEYVQEKMEYKSEDYIARFNNSMEKDVYKAFGNKPIKDVSSADILSIMKNTVERVLNQGKHGTGESAANINRRFIGLVMRYAIVTLRVENDPTYAVSEAIESPKIEHARPFKSMRRMLYEKRLTFMVVLQRSRMHVWQCSILRSELLRLEKWNGTLWTLKKGLSNSQKFQNA